MGWLTALFSRRRAADPPPPPPPIALGPVKPPPATLTDVLRERIEARGGPTAELDRGRWDALATRIAELADTCAPLSFPSVASQVLALASKPALDLNELVGLVQRDAAIATALLRIANSAAFSPTVPITTLRGAVGLVGVRSVVEIVVGTAGRSLYEIASPDDLAMFPTLWQSMFDEAMANAFTAGRLALDLPNARSERALLAGLLSDIGRPIALRIVGGLIRNGLDIPDEALLMATLDESALRIRTAIVSAMRLPDDLRAACVVDAESTCVESHIATLACAVGAIQRRSPRIWTSAGEVRAAAERLRLAPLFVRSIFAQREQYLIQARELFAARAA